MACVSLGALLIFSWTETEFVETSGDFGLIRFAVATKT